MPANRRQNDRLFVCLILLIHFLLLLPGFVSPERKVLCFGLNDVATQFSHWRAFAAAAWLAGEAPLWSPLTYCGQAMLGNFQSAAIYPLNAPYLFLPLHIGLNLEMFLHLAIFALSVFALARRWGVSPAGSFLAAMAASFAGPHFQALMAGHLTIVTTLAWMPLILLALHHIAQPLTWGRHPACRENCVESNSSEGEQGWGWTLAGAAALAMQVMAGHPQMVYYTLLAGGIYFALLLALRRRWEAESPALVKPLIQGAIVIALGFGLSAFQMAAGLAALGDIERGGGYGLDTARTFSPPLESLLTIIFPDVAGNDIQTPFWGRRRYLNLFMGIIPLALAAIGLARGRSGPRRTAAAMMAILGFFMIAGMTPVFAAVYHGLPGYDLFRGYYRWAFFWSVFVAIAAGMGYDALRASLSERSSERRLPVGLLGGMTGLGLALTVMALALRAMSGPESALGEAWARWFARFHSDETQFTPQVIFNLTPELTAAALRHALQSVTRAGIMLMAAGGAPLLALKLPAGRGARVAALLLALGVAEPALYAVRFVQYTPASHFNLPGDVREAVLKNVGPQERCMVFAIGLENVLMPLGVLSPGGYDQFVPRRMGAFLAQSQQVFESPTFAGMRALSLSNYHPRMSLLRVSHVLQIYTIPATPGALVYEGELMDLFRVAVPPLPEALLVEKWRPAGDLDAALEAVFAKEFDPVSEAVVEGAPTFPPGSIAASVRPLDAPYARVTRRGVNFIEVEAWTPREALLVVTNGHMSGWRAKSLGDAKTDYEVVPANGAVMGAGLGAGLHHLRLYYWPQMLTVGLLINLIALIVFVTSLVIVIKQRSKG